MSYSWRQIYRFLSANDHNGEGKVPLSVFEEALNQTKTFLSRQEINSLTQKFGNPVDYTKISQDVMGITDARKKL
jgi:hypothetical protein